MASNKPRLVVLLFSYCVIIPCIYVNLGLKVVSAKSKSADAYSLSDILDDLDLHSDNRVRPGYGERVLEIHAFAFLRSIVEINERESTITVNLLFMQIWDDPRLSFPSGNLHGVQEILIDNPDFMSRFWSPDIFIVNEVKGAHECSSAPALANQIVRLRPNGSILKTTRLTVTVSCPMRHRSYPFHNFDCDIELESFGHKTDDILFLWRNGSKSMDSSKIDRMALASRTSYALEAVETHSQQSYLDTGGSYSKLIIRLYFSKLWLRHAITFFFPTMLLTIASLGTLWVFKNAVITGLITNFIVAGLIILLGGLEYSVAPLLTQVPFLTPVDVHLGICLAAVFLSIAYHGLVFCMAQSDCRRKNLICSEENITSCPRAKNTQSHKVAEAGYSANTEKFITSHDTLKKSENNEQITYYESFDVTNDAIEGGHDEDEPVSCEQHQFMKKRADVLDEEGHHSNKVSEFSSSEGGEGAVGKMKTQTMKMLQGCSARLLGTSLTISRWMIMCSFFLAEMIFWYTYLTSD